ncbi:MAG TPA: ATP-dependent sacrificial sulfur transferase LarE [Candidatus Aquilonibacter sp.]|nr:ATP-dependent sacrificial sulfur transferase LarE [Candidatus Aquilonibacter sp.]
MPSEIDKPSEELEHKLATLRASLAALGSLLVAYSGGTDSAYLAFLAHQVLGPRMLAVIADSPSLPRAELAAALAFAQEHSIPVETLATQELANPDYQRNDAQRCFHCKDELFTLMEQLRSARGFAHIAYGRNLDDDGDFRPGQRAAVMHHAVAPLAAARLHKAEIRALARAAGLSLADKPASACLSSRIEYGRAVTAEALAQVEAAEAALHALGFTQLRVRHHGELARIELTRDELPRALSLDLFDQISRELRTLGFRYITLDLEGFRSGSMNVLLPASSILSAGPQS